MPLKILTIFGTRPEAIKLAPVVRELESNSAKIDSVVCVTAQHRQMLDQVLSIFQINPHYDLNIMTDGQDLFEVTGRALDGIGKVLKIARPDLVLVQGDTTTAFTASLAAYYLHIPLGHIEAGLRTYDKYDPFPEEKNRHMISVLADFHFAPTPWAKDSLVKENINPDRIWVTGNTVIDALLSIIELQQNKKTDKKWCEYFQQRWGLDLMARNQRILLVTGHRRESFGRGLKNICLALAEIAARFSDIVVVYPVHLNPNVQKPVAEILGPIRQEAGSGMPKGPNNNIYLIQPLEYEPFVFLMRNAYLVLTDSGGIQEEAPSLGKPVIVMRDITERPEGIEAGTSMLASTRKESIVNAVSDLVRDTAIYDSMAKVNNPYGDGKAAQRIVKIIAEVFDTH